MSGVWSPGYSKLYYQVCGLERRTRGVPASDGTGAEGSNLGAATGLGVGEWDGSAVPGGGVNEGARERDVREEARREVEEERGRPERGASGAFEEGLRMRRREYDMPGSMPGMMVS